VKRRRAGPNFIGSYLIRRLHNFTRLEFLLIRHGSSLLRYSNVQNFRVGHVGYELLASAGATDFDGAAKRYLCPTDASRRDSRMSCRTIASGQSFFSSPLSTFDGVHPRLKFVLLAERLLHGVLAYAAPERAKEQRPVRLLDNT